MRFLLPAVALAAATPVAAQPATGDFTGKIMLPSGQTLRLALRLTKASDGTTSGSLISIDQGNAAIPIRDVAVEGAALRFAVPAVGGSYAGTWDAARKLWQGRWSQGPLQVPLDFAPGAMPAPTMRPPLAVPASWTMPAPAAKAAELVAAHPTLAIGIATIDRGRVQTATRGGRDASGITAATRFEIGSISKIFTDLLLADAVVRGEVALDDPIAKHLPAGAWTDHGPRPVTLRDLAEHRSGLPRMPDNFRPADPLDPYADYDEAKLFAWAKTARSERAPGEMVSYSNGGVALLGQILARRTDMDWATLVRRRILAPLGMNDTSLDGARLAVPHDEVGRAVKPWRLTGMAPAGGLRSTPQDMAKFAGAFLSPPKVLAPAIQLMLGAPQTPMPPRGSIGLGLITTPTSAGPLVGHNGGTGGFRSAMFIDRARGRAVVVLVNQAGKPDADDAALGTISGYVRPAPPPPPAPPARPAS